MARLSWQLLLGLVLALTLSVVLLGACSTRVSSGGAASTPTRPAAVTAVAPMGPPAPTKTVPVPTVVPAATRPAGPTGEAGPVAWTLTILHTGEVYGDVLPCG